MSKKVVLVLQDELFSIIAQEVSENPFDYENKVSIFVRGCIIRRLRELGKIK